MRDKREDKHTNSEHPMRKRRFRFTFYSVAVLIVLLIVALTQGKEEDAPLFDKNAPTTLYVKTPAGVKPEFNAADYFPEAELDAEKFSFDWSGCDLDVPGTYLAPVFYDGKQTTCVVSLEVLPGTGGERTADGERAAGGEWASDGGQASGGERAADGGQAAGVDQSVDGDRAAIGESDGKGVGTEIRNIPEGGQQ